MRQRIALVSLVVPDYEAALAFYVGVLGFELVEDRPVPAQGKRWVVIRPPGAPPDATDLLLARAATAEQASRIGDQTGGRVFLFLYTDDFRRDYEAYRARGVEFVRGPRRSRTAPSPCSAIRSATCGTCSSRPAAPAERRFSGRDEPARSVRPSRCGRRG
jgi:catechol 2,3-dioxygenase-like lactoylglutathione lyase family enzyme